MTAWTTRRRALVGASLLLVSATLVARAQGTVTPNAQGPAPAAPTTGRRGGPESFPAQQRPPADPAIVERGRVLYSTTCSSCHGTDARGGQLGGPNLLRSTLVLGDNNGEQIGVVVRQGRPGTGMVPIAMGDADVGAVAAFLHSLQAASRGQGAPPPGAPVELDIVVGDRRAGEALFKQTCAGCHSPTGDLAGVASRITDPRTLQNMWVAGGRGGRGASDRRTVTATITPATGPAVTGRLIRLDDFLVTVALADGTIRSVARRGNQPRVLVNDPLERHRTLLATYTNAQMRDVTAYLVTLK